MRGIDLQPGEWIVDVQQHAAGHINGTSVWGKVILTNRRFVWIVGRDVRLLRWVFRSPSIGSISGPLIALRVKRTSFQRFFARVVLEGPGARISIHVETEILGLFRLPSIGEPTERWFRVFEELVRRANESAAAAAE